MSQPEFKGYEKDSALEEKHLQDDFKKNNNSLNRKIKQKNPLIAVPDQKISIIDLMPRL